MKITFLFLPSMGRTHVSQIWLWMEAAIFLQLRTPVVSYQHPVYQQS